MKKMPRQKYLVFLVLLLSGIISAAVCDDLFGMKLTTETLKAKGKARYRFHYIIKDDSTGDYKTQEEIREGDSVHGSYTLAEPNGDLRTVIYKAGPGRGFEAKVDIHPSASPMKQTTEETTSAIPTVVSSVETADELKTKISATPKSNGKEIPGRVLVDNLRKSQIRGNAETGMTISQNMDVVTESVISAATVLGSNATEVTDTTPEPTKTTFIASPSENFESSTSENSGETAIMTEDPIEKELDQAENSMPKLPEVLFPDNKTHLKFYKDPEEAFIDERITQIARQLAETSLRRQYEERKLGHFIPISVTSVEPSTANYLSKSFRFTMDDPPSFGSFQQPPLQMLTHVKLIPQYIYKETMLPRFLPANQRLPVIQTSTPFRSEQWDQQTYDTITNVPEILKINKSIPRIKEINQLLGTKKEKNNRNYDTTHMEAVSVVPIHAPTFLQFFSPYIMPTQGNYVTQPKPGSQLHVTPVYENLSKVPIMISSEQDKKS